MRRCLLRSCGCGVDGKRTCGVLLLWVCVTDQEVVMWVFTEDGFYSAVRERRAGKHKGQMVVRGRSLEDLERFVAKYADGKASPIHTTGGGEFTDYGYRFWMSPEDFGSALARVAEAVEYTNFKSRALKTLGSKREHLLHDIWSVMAKVQPGGAYGVGGSKRQLHVPHERVTHVREPVRRNAVDRVESRFSDWPDSDPDDDHYEPGGERHHEIPEDLFGHDDPDGFVQQRLVEAFTPTKAKPKRKGKKR